MIDDFYVKKAYSVNHRMSQRIVAFESTSLSFIGLICDFFVIRAEYLLS